MTEQESKELKLFKEWFDCEGNYDLDEGSAEQAWFARSKLDKDKSEETNL